MKVDIYKILGGKKPHSIIPKDDDLILLVGVENNTITKSGLGSQVYKNFKEVKQFFPELDAEEWTENFTWSQGYQKLRYFQFKPFGLERDFAIRFETRAAYEFYSH